MTEKLTARQRTILEFIRDRIRLDGRAPTIREIGERFGIRSTNGVRDHLKALIRKGFLAHDSMLSRGIRLVDRVALDVGSLPLVGSAPAGSPITAIENYEGEIAVDKSFISTDDAFTLRVVGDSMINAGINNGDLVIVRKQSHAKEGDIVVAVVEDEATVKRIHFDKRTSAVVLQPENDKYDPLRIDPETTRFYIAGVVEGLMRRLR
ncbi:MAG TPA: transcriptional repressor LexA [candidate division Zixibacteria bacterium]|nr:transcriptional repressor LexA [candidate division Zixibacteria bacterium]